MFSSVFRLKVVVLKVDLRWNEVLIEWDYLQSSVISWTSPGCAAKIHKLGVSPTCLLFSAQTLVVQV